MSNLEQLLWDSISPQIEVLINEKLKRLINDKDFQSCLEELVTEIMKEKIDEEVSRQIQNAMESSEFEMAVSEVVSTMTFTLN